MKVINRFKSKQFQEAIKDKMFDQMIQQRKRIGLREYAEDINISASTLSRVYNGKTPDLETFFRLCFWMKRPTNEFYKH